MCTGCGRSSDWENSRYERHVADEAVGGRPVRTDLLVRRLYCENPACPKVTFAEQIAGLTVRYQRRTAGLQAIVVAVARRADLPERRGGLDLTAYRQLTSGTTPRTGRSAPESY
ncbi:hypothetical protein BKM31_55365 [[Actinomadura] parvosata subsp. kistnae]|uniref:Transposase IS204/IS1001/IS1096/IS1165 zinc-finger domain-containing protein n=2 Tax=Nonomuraea TaxID=83681 RepID=A0A1V0AGW7_9ACTN|nr:hypothetical protein BKM31_55365 [Nonomuraea sp. ATCC 55076]